MTYRIVDLDKAESDRLLERIYDQIEDPELIYEHVWSEGDLLIWDNRACLHARTDFDPAEPRKLRRMSLASSEKPMAYSA